MLERFRTSGPTVAERGEGFLYAQGAKSVARELEQTRWPLPADRTNHKAKSRRLLFVRIGGKGYVLMTGRFGNREIAVPAEQSQGLVSHTWVEASMKRSRVQSIKAIGSYPADMIVGRVVKIDKKLRLQGLFTHDGVPVSLYDPLPLSGGIPIDEGEIVQAFVRPTLVGPEASPMINLGREVTPEIAAREILLRRGARGYFDDAVIRQAEKTAREHGLPAVGERVRDMRGLALVTMDPPGAGDLDDAFHIERAPDGGYIWTLATASMAEYSQPGTQAFRSAARIGNTFYSFDKDGTGEYPMNHPIFSKGLASLLPGKDSLAMITRMHFDANGRRIEGGTETFMALVRSKGRYTYEQVAAQWKGEKGHGVTHVEQIEIARELAAKLAADDLERGKLNFNIPEAVFEKKDGRWTSRVAVEDPLLKEAHRLIEELKVYGNRNIADVLTEISTTYKIPHISRIHPEQDPDVDDRLRRDLETIGAPWTEGRLADYLGELPSRPGLSPDVIRTAMTLTRNSRTTAEYVAVDDKGHDGLALEAGQYDHPSTPIRRFSDMYNQALLQAYLSGGDPKKVYDAIINDLRILGFADLKEYLNHLNARQKAAKETRYEFENFMAAYELSKPENVERPLRGYVSLSRGGRTPRAVISLREPAVSFSIRGEEARAYALLDEVEVTSHGKDAFELMPSVAIRPLHGRPAPERLTSKEIGLRNESRMREHLASRDYALLHRNMKIFGKKNKLITEIDAIARAKDGKVELWESKSVWGRRSADHILHAEINPKLAIFERHLERIRDAASGRLDGIVFYLDVGPRRSMENDLRKLEPELTRKAGMPVRFVFVER